VAQAAAADQEGGLGVTYQVIIGDCIEGMRTLPDQSVHTCVTSPPYFGLRDYGMAGQIGLEDTPDTFVARLVEVFREVRRVLRDDGTLWLNLGDTYARNPAKGQHKPGDSGKQAYIYDNGGGRASSTANVDLPEKNLLGIPWRVAFALQADGWYLRQDIIWHKLNPMPESVTDRCTKAHEYVFMLSKSARYFFDADAIKEPAVKGASGSTFHKGKTGVHQADRSSKNERIEDGTRNRRSVWTVASKPFKGAHFATFPPDLIEPCILAGSPVGGTVLDPFGGSGTTAGVAMRNGRSAILCELNPEYATLIPARIADLGGNQGDLFQRAAEILDTKARALRLQGEQADAVGHDTSADMDRFAAQMIEGAAATIRKETP
jgi:DNA modification methylase